MTTETAAIFVISGTLLNMIGIAYAVRALLLVWSTYGHGPLWPWVAKQTLMTSQLLLRLKFWSKRKQRIHAVSVSASSQCGASVEAVLRKRLIFDDDTSDEEKIKKLVDAIHYIYRELDEKQERFNRKHESLAVSLNALSKRMDSKGDNLEKQMKDIATGDVRPQLISILLIGVGTFTAVIPAIYALFY